VRSSDVNKITRKFNGWEYLYRRKFPNLRYQCDGVPQFDRPKSHKVTIDFTVQSHGHQQNWKIRWTQSVTLVATQRVWAHAYIQAGMLTRLIRMTGCKWRHGNGFSPDFYCCQ